VMTNAIRNALPQALNKNFASRDLRRTLTLTTFYPAVYPVV